jgi:hypothetical protein
MDQINTPQLGTAVTEPTPTHQGRRRWLIPAAAVGLGAVAVAAVWQLRAEDPEAGAAAVATQFIQATYAYDLDAAQAMLTEDVNIDDGTVAEWRDGLAWDKAIGTSLAELACAPGSTTPSGTQVHCIYSFNSLGSEELGRGPYPGTYDLTVTDGQIAEAHLDFPFAENGFSQEMWEPMESWVWNEHEEDFLLLYGEAEKTPAEQEQALNAWTRNVAAYVAASK